MKNKIILLSKEVLLPEYIEVYGGKFWKTPNINDIAAKGTIFKNHYTAAPSTAMSFTSMHSGIYPHETNRKDYVKVNEFRESKTTFHLLDELGYSTHVLWSTNYSDIKEKYTRIYSPNTVFHDKVSFNQSVGVHLPFKNIVLSRNDDKANEALKYISSVINEVEKLDKIFLWIHLPHVISGRTSYGDDIDLVDIIVGFLRKSFGDESIFITADHGHMNLDKGRTTYGFDVYQNSIRVPLITPKVNNLSSIEYPTSHIQLKDLLIKEFIERKDYIISDSAYYAQPFRKTALIKDNYKLIYNKLNNSYEFYDITWDPFENHNILKKRIVDHDRQRKVLTNQIYFYPYYEESLRILNYLKNELKKIWRKAGFIEEKTNFIVRKLKNFKAYLKRIFK